MNEFAMKDFAFIFPIKALVFGKSELPVCRQQLALTSCVCAFGAAGLRRGLQGSFAGIGGIRLHVRLLIVMMRIGENPVLLHCPTGHHFL